MALTVNVLPSCALLPEHSAIWQTLPLLLLVLMATASAAGTTQQSPPLQFTSAVTPFVSGLHNPTGVTVDSQGNVYIDNSLDGSLTKYTKTGTGWQSTPVASGLGYSFTVAVDANGNVFTINNDNGCDGNCLVEYSPANGSYSRSVVAMNFNNPYGMVLDPTGTILFVSDTDNNQVIKLTLSKGTWR